MLREKYCFDSRNELINSEFALRILTQNCLDQLNKNRSNKEFAKTEKICNNNNNKKTFNMNNNNNINRSINISKIKKRDLSSKNFNETIKLGRFEIKKKLKMVL